MKSILLKNARIIDPSRDLDEMGGVFIQNGKIVEAGRGAHAQNTPEGTREIDLDGLTVIPGLVDGRVFIGEPGAEHLDDIASSSQAAVAGGVTSLIMMPDTNPVIDNAALVTFVLKAARDNARMRIYPMGSITRGFRGEEMTEFGLLKEAGAVAFCEGRQTVERADVLRHAMSYARDFDMPIVHETQDRHLVGNGVMNSGLLASWLGLPGIVREAEVIPLERDLRLAALSGVRYHAAQISTAQSVEVIDHAKQRGLAVSAAVSINHLTLNEYDIGEYRTFYRLSPPLRAEEDRLAMVEALREGQVDMIVSSHDPQGVEAKRQPFADARGGSVGLETLLAAALRLYHEGSVPLKRLVEVLSTAPARLFNLDAGTLRRGANADLAVVDLEEPWVLTLDMLHSHAKNSVFENARFQGRVVKTMVGGEFVYDREHGISETRM